ncbi:hypothetical protein [Paraburkholderia sp.]|jgi:hypothetical protein|uniref:hypothetical protein n=1 Tax=Paraburkholderia sp. TaxID=1926495 RepID=UPI002F42C75E
MTVRIKITEDILAPGVAAGLLSTVALALCGKLHGKQASAPVSAVSRWVWPQEARRTAHPAPRHLIAGLLIHQTMSIGWAAFNALALATLRYVIERRGDAQQRGALAGLAHIGAQDRNGADGRGDEAASAARDTRSREHVHRVALAVATTAAAAVGDYIVVPKRFTPGFEYHLPARHIAMVYIAFGAGLTVPFVVKQWMAGRSAASD